MQMQKWNLLKLFLEGKEGRKRIMEGVNPNKLYCKRTCKYYNVEEIQDGS
jgi:hypothetical protein